MSPEDEALLRRAVAIAAHARAAGNHPFGALLADASGAVLVEAGNAVVTANDPTAHAEMVLVRAAAAQFPSTVLASCSLYASTEPCAMCAGGTYWTGIGRVVYAMSESELLRLTGESSANPTMHLGCRVVFDAGQRRVEVIGPAPPGSPLASDAVAVHRGFWS
ncbi:MAG TPA: nucleoside deaminase [Acidimicrobiales bacterium]|nr:nucleoside deaminase [Acidimicrobiales bacterium]